MSTKWKSEIELLRASRTGNAQAFGVLIDNYAALVCAITYSATGNTTESEELAQETFLQAWKSLGQLKDLSKFRPWLCRIARSTAQNWFRHRKRDGAGRTAPLEAAAGRPSEETGPAEAAIGREQEAVIRQALTEIPLNLREPLVLFYREQQSTRQVAIQLGLSENAARQRISRGRAMLRAQVASMVENTLVQTRPGKAFKTAVIAAVAGSAIKTTTTTAAATGLMSTLAGKIALTAAGVALVAGAVWVQQRGEDPHRIGSTPNAQISREIDTPSPVAASPETETTAANHGEARRAALPGSQQTTALPETQTVEKTEQNSEPIPASDSEAVTPSFEFTPQGVLSGLVTDAETGEPIPDAVVRISSGPVSSARTNSEGLYHFDEVHQAGDFSLFIDTVTHIGIYQGQENPIIDLSNDKQVVRHFGLSKACMANVWVVDENGVGIPDAVVVVTLLSNDSFGTFGAFADRRRTDPNGYVLVGGIPPEDTDYLVTAWHRAKVDRRESDRVHPQDAKYDHALGKAVVRLADPNEIAEVTVVLGEGESVVGRAEYADGVPATRTCLSLSPRWWHCGHAVDSIETDDTGTFTFDHVASGFYNIFWDKPFAGGALTISHAIMQAELLPDEGAPLLVRLPENSPQTLVSIRGMINFPSEATPGIITITASSTTSGPIFEVVQCEDDGTTPFEVKDLNPGIYTLAFGGGNLQDETIRDVVAPSDDLVVAMVVATRPTLTGTVLDTATGRPVERFQARVRTRQPSIQSRRWIQFDDVHGRFSLETTGPGVYEVQVLAEGYAAQWSEPIDTDASQRIEVQLTQGGSVTGQIVDEQGRPVRDATVIPLSLACGATEHSKGLFVSETGAVKTIDGRFHLAHLAPGLETLKVTHPHYAFTVAEEIPVLEGESTGGIQIVLREGGVVEGYVYDGEGQTLAHEAIVVQNTEIDPTLPHDEVGHLASVTTDSNGFYRVEHLPEKSCLIRRGSQSQPLGVVQRTVVPSMDCTTRLDLGGTPIVAGVVAIDGVAQANTYLRLNPVDPSAMHTFHCYAMTDTEGTFAFHGVVPGTHRICHQSPDKYPAWQQIALIEVNDCDVDIGVLPAVAP